MTLGQVLKSKRLELGKSIEQIASATRIHVKVLQAIEDDRYSDLPARAFTRGFIISYCKILHLDHEKILKEYHDFLESKYAERPEKDHGHQGYAFEGKETEQNRRWLMIIASGAAFFAVLTLLFFKPHNQRHKEKHKELIAEESESVPTEASPSPSGTATAAVAATGPNASATPAASPTSSLALTPTTTPTLTPTPVPTPTLSPTPKEDPLNKGDSILPSDAAIRIEIKSLEDTLIRYHSDERKISSIMLRKDKILVIKAMDVIRIQTDHPEQLKYKLRFKDKPQSAYTDLTEQRLEIRADGQEQPFAPGSL